MVVFCTRKLAAKLGLFGLPRSVLSATNTAWYANLTRINSKQFIFATETSTLVTVVMPGRGITSPITFAENLMSSISATFFRKHWDRLLGTIIAFDSPTNVEFKAAVDRRIIGSQNDLIHVAQWQLESDTTDIDAVIDQINQTPMSLTGMRASVWILEDLKKATPPQR
jgi:Domain of unknown function (DUF6933)